eukprot:617328-Ditylum_brightwellii.AAC.1
MDGTTCRQSAFQDLVVGAKENGKLDPVIVSSCIYLEGKKSEIQKKTITTVLVNLNISLVQWREITEREFPGRLDVLELISIPGSVNVVKIGNNGATTFDTCNS